MKYLLKNAVRGIILNKIIDRKKQGFAAPIPKWAAGELRKEAGRQLKEFCEAPDLLNWRGVEVLLNSEKRSNAWHLLNAAMWGKTYIQNSPR